MISHGAEHSLGGRRLLSFHGRIQAPKNRVRNRKKFRSHQTRPFEKYASFARR